MTSDKATSMSAAKAWRLAKGYTQEGLANALGVSESTIIHMERGTRPSGQPIGRKDWQRYCLQCAGLEYLKGQPHTAWDWPEG
jgi:Helix-turn-helix